MKRIFLITLGVLICFSVYSQRDDLRLFKLPDKKHSIRVKTGAWLSLSRRLYTPDSMRVNETISGRLVFATNDSINLNVDEYITSSKIDSALYKQTMIRKQGWPNKPYKTESYPLSDIRMLRYQNKSGEVFTKVGTYLFFASLVTAAVVAPLVSIDYKNGTFNMDTYKSVVIAGGIGIGISIPIMIFSGKKYVYFEDGKAKCRKKVHTYIKPLN